jgi:uncharacterized protein (TIGR03437 family)
MSLSKNQKILAGKLSALAVAVPILLYAYASGPDPRNTGAPGDQTCNQPGCHVGTPLNGGGGNVAITFSNGLTYSPGVKQQWTVTVTDSAARRYGFQATARLASNPSAGQAGTFSNLSSATQIMCDDGRVMGSSGCRANFNVEFIEHTRASTANTFTFDWTPPSTDVGNVEVYVAANAANGDANNTGDHIYTAHYTLTPASSVALPAISSGGVGEAFTGTPGVAPSAWTAIYGKNFAPAGTLKTWDSAIQGNTLPTTLDGLSVSINGKPATIYFYNDSQINVLAPNDIGTGPVQVMVTNSSGSRAPRTVQAAADNPAFYTLGRDGSKLYVTAVALDGAYVGKVGAGDPRVTRAARPGEVLLVFGTGFGATNPVAPTNQIVSGAPAITTPVRIRFGETVATFAGTGNLVAAGLYQFNVTVPDTLADGEYPLIAETGGVTSSANVYIPIQR